MDWLVLWPHSSVHNCLLTTVVKIKTGRLIDGEDAAGTLYTVKMINVTSRM